MLIGGIIFNSTFFLHAHRTACGNIVVHAHPFNKKAEKGFPFSKHQHKIDLHLIGAIHYYTFTDNNIEISYKLILEREVLNRPYYFSNSYFDFSFNTRGPPTSYTHLS